VQLHRDRDKFEQAGANLVVIGQGSPRQAARFRDTQHLELPLLVDPNRRSYRAAGAKVATLSELVGPRVLVKGALRGARAGVHQGKTIGHPAQLGGVLVVSTDGSVTWSHMSDDASDNPPNEEVLDAVRRAVAAG